MDRLSCRILLVDDDKEDSHDVRELMTRTLTESSALDWVAGYEEALAVIGRNSHDAVLINYRRGDRDGLELLRDALAQGCKMPLILLTGQDDRGVDLEAMEVGAADFLVKGRTTPEMFDRSIRYAIRHKRVRDQLRLLNTLRQQLAPPAARSAPTGPPVEPSLADLGLCILVADDSDTSRRVATIMLERWGCRVETATSGREALQRAQQSSYDAILMDVQMPEMEGPQATELIRAWEHGQGRHTPIVALTAHGREADHQRCLDSGMDAVLRKPIRSQELFDLLSTWGKAMPRSRERNAPPPAPRPALWILRLDEICGDDLPLRAEILRNFVSEADQAVVDIEEALVQRDSGRVGRAAHRLKGNCLTVGVDVMARACWGLEELGKKGEFANAGILLSQVRAEFHRVRGEMLHCVDDGIPLAPERS
ncbi:MAG: response regulator [Isosphaeraceae bacterium]|nr:response regulator [Isosphaeraceae bacterium]